MSLRLSAQTVLALAAFAAAGTAEPAAAQSGRPQFFPNSRKYSDAGAKVASGRSGSASLEARALLAKDGTALLEASTGSLEAGTAPGQIRKVQVRLLSNAGAQLGVDNYNGLSGNGYWSKSYPELGRNSKVEIQANVGGIDGNRNDVVTATTLVKRSPDVTVRAVTAPASVLAGSRVTIVGTIAELNGDVGARATCVLAVDGRAADQASGIWVDAGQSVSCAFETDLGAVGVHQVQVYATGVSPADWDASNNSVTTSIEVLSPERLLGYDATFTGKDISFTTQTNKTSVDGEKDNSSQTGTNRDRAMTLISSTKEKTFAFPVTVHSSLASAGVSVYDASIVVPYDATASSSTADCGKVYQVGYILTVCNNHSTLNSSSAATVTLLSGRVTYLTSHSLTLGGDWYVQNDDGLVTDRVTGLGAFTVGGDVKPVLELTDAHGLVFAARPTISVASTPTTVNTNFCTTNRRTGLTTCTITQQQGSTYSGHVATP